MLTNYVYLQDVHVNLTWNEPAINANECYSVRTLVLSAHANIGTILIVREFLRIF